MMRHLGPVWAVLAILAGAAAAQPPQPPADRGTLSAGLPPGAVVRLGGPRWPYEDHLNRLAFSPDGTLLACAGVRPADLGKPGAEYAIQLRDGHGGKLLAELLGHEGTVRAIAFSADSKTLVSAGKDETVRLWNAADGRLLWTAAGCDAAQVAFSADGKQIIAARSARQIVLLDRAGGSKQKEIVAGKPAPGPKIDPKLAEALGEVVGDGMVPKAELKVSPSGATFRLRTPSGKTEDVPRVWIKPEVWAAMIPRQETFTLVPDGKGLIEAPGELRLVFRDALSGSETASSGVAQPLVAMVCTTATGKPFVERCLWPSVEQTGCEVLPGLLSLVDPASGKVLKTLADSSKPPYRNYHSIAFSADGKRIAMCRWLPERTLEVVVRPLDQEKDVARFVLFGGFRLDVGKRTSHPSRVFRWAFAAFSPDGARIAVISQNGLRLCEVATGKELGPDDETATRPLDVEHQSFLHAVVFSPDGSLVATAAADGIVALWSAKTGKGLARWSHDLVFSTEWPVAFSPDGSLMAYASGHEIPVVRTADGQEVSRLSPGERPGARGAGLTSPEQREGAALAFSPDGKRVVAWFVFENYLVEWETNAWKELRSTRLQPPQVDMAIPRAGQTRHACPSVTFSPTLRRMTMGRQEGSMLFTFHTQSGQSLFKAGAAEPFTSARFSPDESLLALGVPDGTIQIVDVRQGQTVQTLRGPAGMTFVRAFLEDGRVLASYHGDRATRFWDVRTGREIGRWDGHCLWACSPDERLAATVSAEYDADDLDRTPDQYTVPAAIFLWDLRALAGQLRKGPPSQPQSVGWTRPGQEDPARPGPVVERRASQRRTP